MPVISNFFFGLFSISSNFPYNYIPYFEPHYLELSLCRTNFWSLSSIISLSQTFSSRRSIFKENSSKTLKFDRIFIFLCSFIIIRTLFFIFNRNTVSVKQKLNVKNLNEKWKVLRDLESSLSNKEVTAKYGVPKNTVSTWVKNKAKFFTALEQCSNERKKLRKSNYKRVDDVVFNGFYPKEARIY